VLMKEKIYQGTPELKILKINTQEIMSYQPLLYL